MSSSRVLSAFQLKLVKMCLKDGFSVYLLQPKVGTEWEYIRGEESVEGFSLLIQAGAAKEGDNIGSSTVVMEAKTEEDYQALAKQLGGYLGAPGDATEEGKILWE